MNETSYKAHFKPLIDEKSLLVTLNVRRSHLFRLVHLLVLCWRYAREICRLMLQNLVNWETQILLVACFYDVLQPQLMSFYIPQKLEYVSQFTWEDLSTKKPNARNLMVLLFLFFILYILKSSTFVNSCSHFIIFFVAFCGNYFEINETFSACQTFQYFLKKGPKRIGKVFLSHFVIKTVI